MTILPRISVFMMAILLAGCGVAPSSSDLADVHPRDRATTDLFAGSSEIAEQRGDLIAQGFTQSISIDDALYSQGCGFAGCDSEYIVVETLGTDFGANNQTTSVLGLVSRPAIGNPEVRLAEITMASAAEELTIPTRDPKDAFAASTVVAELLQQAGDSSGSGQDAVRSFLIAGSCGFAGCEETYFVSKLVTTAGSNPRSVSVGAVVKTKVPFSNQTMTVELAAITPVAEASEETLYALCSDGETNGLQAKIYRQNGTTSRAVLERGGVAGFRPLAELNVCRDLVIDPTNPTDGPWTTLSCNNTEWDERYNLDYIVSGFQGDRVEVRHNEQKLGELACILQE